MATVHLHEHTGIFLVLLAASLHFFPVVNNVHFPPEILKTSLNWLSFPKVFKKCKYITSGQCQSLISTDLASMKQTWNNFISVADKGRNFYYNPHYLLQLNEFVNTAKAQVV